jgi:hypothetical protein
MCKATPTGRKLMKLCRSVELGDLINYGNFYFDRVIEFGSIGCPYLAYSIGKLSMVCNSALQYTEHDVLAGQEFKTL